VPAADRLRLHPLGVLAASFAAGSIPFSGCAARLLAGVDLREHGSGTVSGTGLYEVTGFGPLAVAGSLEVAKGAVGPLLAGRGRPLLGALAGSLAIAGHNWSPLLGGQGGRGISTALGATLASAPEGTVVLAAGLAGGRVTRQTGLGCFLAIAALPFLLARTRGLRGFVAGVAISFPMLAKRVTGNSPLPRGGPAHAGQTKGKRLHAVLHRLVFDSDPPGRPDR
jgi:glycerol-3-phosphate acyltransferase PlsY